MKFLSYQLFHYSISLLSSLFNSVSESILSMCNDKSQQRLFRELVIVH